MYFSINIAVELMVLLAVACVLTVVMPLWRWARTRKLARFVDSEQARNYLSDEELPAVSIVVYAHNDAESLARFLPLILQQDYPLFEVIVVDNGSYDATPDVLSDLTAQYSNLRVTFSPDDTRALSRKKLCLMMGIKAARHDIVLATQANCSVPGNNWLRLMMRNFTPGTDVVLGYSHYSYDEDSGPCHRYRAFDTVTGSIQWLLSAIAGRPYRGTGDNLAYRRRLFFENKGFSKNLDLRWGDDDVFVSEIAHAGNTRVELNPESQVLTHYNQVGHAHSILKLRRDFTLSLVASGRESVKQGLFSMVNYMRLACLIGAIGLDFSNLFVLGMSGLLLVLSWILAIVPYNRAARLLQAPRLLLAVPLLDLWRPVVNFYYRWRGRFARSANYTSIYD